MAARWKWTSWQRTADGRGLLVGEVKWSDEIDFARELGELRRKAANLPLAESKEVQLALWVRSPPRSRTRDAAVFSARDVLRALR